MKNLNFGYLLDFYKSILPKKQQNALDLYYNHDLSLSEIADEFNITRQGVRDSIKKGEQKLLELEEKLMMVSKLKDIEKDVLKIKKEADNLENSTISKMLDNLIEKIYK